MMTETEHLLTCLAEEAGEIVQACGKAMRFGLHNWYPGTDRTNADDIDRECTHLWTVRKMLADRGVFPKPTCRDTFEEKERKVREFMEYSRTRGTLMPNVALTGGEAVPSNGVVGTEHPHPMLCFQHGGSEACEAVNRQHGFTCPKSKTP